MVKITDRSGNEHELTGRLEKIVQAVLENAADIARPQNAQIIFDCSGYTVSASMKKQLEISKPEA